MSDEAKQDRYDQFVDRVEIPMMVLAVLLIPVIIMPVAEQLSTEAERALWLLGTAIWVAFVVEYAVALSLSPDRWHTVKTHKLDLVLVVLPFLRPIRILRVAQAGTAITRVLVTFRRLFGRPGFATIIGVVSGLIVAGGALVSIAEHEQPDSTITGLGDGLWWAFVTCTTVGYGDTFPVTGSGRIIAGALMVAGISGLSAVTANIAAYFIDEDADQDRHELTDRLDRIEQQLGVLIAGPAGAAPAAANRREEGSD